MKDDAKMFINKLIDKIKEIENPSVVGLDPKVDYYLYH